MQLYLEQLQAPRADQATVEVVERKGPGHPDTICDALAEELSRALCRHYLAAEGRILHHNVDKALLRAGLSRPSWGGGEVVEPFELILAGRATAEAGGRPVPVEELAHDSARRWLSTHLHALDPAAHARIACRVRPGSSELRALFARGAGLAMPLANDTSFGCGHAPPSTLERVVRAVADAVGPGLEPGERREAGEDVKVMGLRAGRSIDLTIACAFIDRWLSGPPAYEEARERLLGRARAAASALTDLDLTLTVNAADDPAAGSFYLTVTGTSAESGDDGQVGRGNRVSGLITPGRPMSLEAVAGKNPVSHVGKLYNLLAHSLAGDLVARLEPVREARCLLVSRIGQPVDQPQLVSVALATDGVPPGALRREVEAIVAAGLAGLGRTAERLLAGEVACY